jgi:hypothetical protein
MRFFLAFLVSLFLTSQSFAATLEEDVLSYTRIFSGERGQHLVAADALTYAGISDPRVFDIIEKLVLSDVQTELYDGANKDWLTRYIYALGVSGQDKYVPTLKGLLDNNIYRRFAKPALLEIPRYRQWNPVISNRATFDAKFSDDTNRAMNMLKSDDVLLNRVGAKFVYLAEVKEDVLLEQLAVKLTALYLQSAPNSEALDSVAWLARALGSAKSERYRPLLEQVVASTPNGRVWSFAKEALDQYSR